jgi:hypothetical protein
VTERPSASVGSLRPAVDGAYLPESRNEIASSVLNLRRFIMKQEPIDEHGANEALPTKAERNYGVLTAGVIALVVVGTAIYWIS